MNNIDNYLIAVEKLNRHYLREPIKDHYVTEPYITNEELKKLSMARQVAHWQEVESYNKAYNIWNDCLVDLQTNVLICKDLSTKVYWTNLVPSNCFKPETLYLTKPLRIKRHG